MLFKLFIALDLIDENKLVDKLSPCLDIGRS